MHIGPRATSRGRSATGWNAAQAAARVAEPGDWCRCTPAIGSRMTGDSVRVRIASESSQLH